MGVIRPENKYNFFFIPKAHYLLLIYANLVGKCVDYFGNNLFTEGRLVGTVT